MFPPEAFLLLPHLITGALASGHTSLIAAIEVAVDLVAVIGGDDNPVKIGISDSGEQYPHLMSVSVYMTVMFTDLLYPDESTVDKLIVTIFGIMMAVMMSGAVIAVVVVVCPYLYQTVEEIDLFCLQLRGAEAE